MPKLKLFVINLERSSERKELMLKQLDAFSQILDVEFFNAIDAKKYEHLEFSEHFSSFRSKLYKGRELTDAEKSCFASHYTLWGKCAKLGEPLIVLEDDVLINTNFVDGIADIALGTHEYVRLFALFDKTKYRIKGNYDITFGKVGGTQGYYLTPAAAHKFIEHADSWYCPVDDYMDMFYCNTVPNVLYRPYLLEHSEVETTVGGKRKKPGPFLKFLREMYRIIRSLHQSVYLLFNRKRLLEM